MGKRMRKFHRSLQLRKGAQESQAAFLERTKAYTKSLAIVGLTRRKDVPR